MRLAKDPSYSSLMYKTHWNLNRQMRWNRSTSEWKSAFLLFFNNMFDWCFFFLSDIMNLCASCRQLRNGTPYSFLSGKHYFGSHHPAMFPKLEAVQLKQIFYLIIFRSTDFIKVLFPCPPVFNIEIRSLWLYPYMTRYTKRFTIFKNGNSTAFILKMS